MCLICTSGKKEKRIERIDNSFKEKEKKKWEITLGGGGCWSNNSCRNIKFSVFIRDRIWSSILYAL